MKKLSFLLTLFLSVAALVSCEKETDNPGNGNQNDEHFTCEHPFSIGPDKQVAIASGNLQYQPSSGTYRFAENPWDIIGFDNENIADNYSGWIDLFGWGTGDYPSQTSTQDTDYTAFHEWQYGNGWRTMSAGEWEYLLTYRSDATNLVAVGSIGGMVGMIVAPDDFQGTLNTQFNGWNDNIYTHESWQAMADQGAIFLPAGGIRAETQVVGADEYAYYWSSSTTLPNSGQGLCFDATQFGFYPIGRSHGQSVRMVKDVK